MTTEKRLLGVNPVASGDGAEGVSFDGENDYLSRSSDLVGNTDSKTLTCSFWIYPTEGGEYIRPISIAGDTIQGFNIILQPNTPTRWNLKVTGYNSSDTLIVNVTATDFKITKNTWNHVLVSLDTTDAAKRHIYTNELLYASSWSSYTNDSINFTMSTHNINNYNGGAAASTTKNRLAHVFLDYTYRDLSIESNRRLFIDSDGKPASGQADLSPILYLPMTDADTAGDNAGTGGDFTVNGVLATAERGPNQYNCSASEFDGSNDYLENSSLSMPSDSKLFTVSLWYNPLSVNGDIIDFTSAGNPTNIMTLGPRLSTNLSSSIDLTVYNGVDLSTVFSCKVSMPSNESASGKSRHITISCDVSDTNKRHAVVDGVVTNATWSNYNNINVGWSKHTRCIIGDDFNGGGRRNQQLGEYYLNNSYTDLSTDNPFWDSDANRPKPVAQVIEETGTTPLIALPLRADDAGNNLGTAGDFTVNSGPFEGARGGSEYWARSANFAGNAINVGLSSSSFTASSKTISMSLAIKPTTVSGDKMVRIYEVYPNDDYFTLQMDETAGDFYLSGYNSSHSLILSKSFTNQATMDAWNTILICIDLTDINKCKFVLNGTVVAFPASGHFTNEAILLDSTHWIGCRGSSNDGSYTGDIASTYFSTDYIDFSQESNRNKFVDQLGFPRDLTQQIEDGDIPTPLVYMKFDDTSDLGANSGTGGDFTVNGTVRIGSDVDPNA